MLRRFIPVLYFCLPTTLLVINLSVAFAQPSVEREQTELNNQAVRIAQEGDLKQGVALLRRAYALDPSDSGVTKNLSGMLTDWGLELYRTGQTGGALNAFHEAASIDVTNAAARVHLGDIYYIDRDENEQALHYWREAFSLTSGLERVSIEQRLNQAERDQKLERGYQETATEHFLIRFPETVSQTDLDAFAKLLEDSYAALAAELGPLTNRVTVIIYPENSFERVAGRKDWAIGLYDGKIRLRADELNTDLPLFILPHELAHAFLRGHFGAALPQWLNEGFAQAQEPDRRLSPEEKRLRDRVLSRNLWVPLDWLDRRFETPSNQEDVDAAYMQSKIAVSRLVEDYGLGDLRAFMQRLANGESVEAAFDASFRSAKWSRFSRGSF